MSDPTLHSTRHRQIDADGVHVLYREAGDPANPTLLLVHGFTTSSHMFRHNPAAHVELLDTGHFALETHVDHIAARIREVFDRGP